MISNETPNNSPEPTPMGAFDQSKMDRVYMSKTAISEDQVELTIGVALAAADIFGLKAVESKKILREVFTAVSGWRKTGRKLRLKASTLDTYASAFEHSLMDKTKHLIVNSFCVKSTVSSRKLRLNT